MKQINGNMIIEDMKLKQQLMIWLVVTLVVFIMVVSPIIFFSSDFINACVESLMLLAFIGVPFGYKWGLKKVFLVLKLQNNLKKGRFIAERNVVVGKKKYEEDETYYKIFFDKDKEDGTYSRIYLDEDVDEENWGIVVDYPVFSKIHIGDEYIFILEEGSRNFLKMYSTRDYYL